MSALETKGGWFMTAPHPWKRAHAHSADDGRIGWRWHAVPAAFMSDGQGGQVEHKRRPALCGLRPAHGWGGDIFSDEMCERCRIKAEATGFPFMDGLQRSVLAAEKERLRALGDRS